jgi:hypothetical protein
MYLDLEIVIEQTWFKNQFKELTKFKFLLKERIKRNSGKSRLSRRIQLHTPIVAPPKMDSDNQKPGEVLFSDG